MARLVGFVVALVALVGMSHAFNLSEFKSISNDKGVADDWRSMDGANVVITDDTELFGMAYGGDKLYLISRRNESGLITALHGGIVSALDNNGTWTHKQYSKVDGADDSLADNFFTMAGRLLMLVGGANKDNSYIVVDSLHFWDDDKWTKIPLDISDKDNVFQKLTRGPHNFFGINVPDQDGNVGYIIGTDHEMDKSDSETTFSKLEVAFDINGKPSNASLKPITRIATKDVYMMPEEAIGKAVIGMPVMDNILYALMATFPKDNSTATVNITVPYAIDLTTNKMIASDLVLDANTSLPYVDYTVNLPRLFQPSKDLVIFLGPHTVATSQDHANRHVWALDMAQKKFLKDLEADFVILPNRVFAVDQKKMRLLAAGLVKGAYAAQINKD